ncbi:hydantoinase/oxoprolinase family protein [Chloroflexota bacterium]
MDNGKETEIIACDAGGTMIDMVIVDKEGNFSIGKSATTPLDQSIGYWSSLCDAYEYWSTDLERDSKDILPLVESAVYAGTGMLNVLLTGTGQKVGVITQAGDEDVLLHERARQSYAGYSYQDVLHHVTHRHTDPIVPRKMVKGVTGRIDMFGMEVFPLNEAEVKDAVEYLLDQGVEAIAVCLWYCFLNPSHELSVGEIAKAIIAERRMAVRVHLSHQLAPIIREQARLNTTILNAYAAEPAREQLVKIEQRLHDNGYQRPLQIILSHGGLSDAQYPRLHEATFSGPLGGLLGALHLAPQLGINNWVCSDMGGTSFDVGLITAGEPYMLREVVFARRFFNIPTLSMDSIGAGMGQFVTVDPLSKRPLIGPGSAGAEPGPVSYNAGNEIPTVMDCALIMGILNPDNYLGGKVKLDKPKAFSAIKEQCADPLGVDPYYFAEGITQLINNTMREHIRSVLLARGFSPADYCLIGYGGAGPVHLAGYSDGLPFKGVATVPWAAGFSAFGCAAVDITHRYQKSATVVIPYGVDDDFKMFMGGMMNAAWDELEQQAMGDLKAEGLPWEKAQIKPIAYVRYGGQMEDLEVLSPVNRIRTPQDVDKLLADFDDLYSKVHAGVAQYREAGYHIFEVGLMTVLPKTKPKLIKRSLEDKQPIKDAVKGEREVFANGQWHTAAIYDMDQLRPGNAIGGIAVIEAPATTLFIPPGKHVHMDEWSLLWIT